MTQYDINLREYWRIIKKRKYVVILLTIVMGLFSSSFAILKAPLPLYSTACLVEIQKQPTAQGVYTKAISFSESDDIATQVSIVKSYRIFQKVAEELALLPRGTSGDDRPLKENVVPVIEGLQAKVEVTREGYTSILRIEVTDGDPAFARKLANAIGRVYKDSYAEQQMKQTTAALKYISEQLAEVREKLRQAEDQFNRFTKDNELLAIDLQGEALLAKSQAIQSEVQKLREEKGELEGILGRLNEFEESSSVGSYDFYSAKASTQYQATNDTLVGLLLKRETLLKDFTSKHPEVISIGHQVIECVRKMVFLLQHQIRGMQKREGEYVKELESVERKTQLLMDRKLEFDRLKRRVELYNDMTALLERKNQEALIGRAERPQEVNIIKPALLPESPINSPNTVSTGIMGILIGLILGTVVAFVAESFDTSLGAIEDVEETLGTKVVGIIPHGDPQSVRESLKVEDHELGNELSVRQVINLISHFMPKSMMAEGFRALRTNIQFMDTEKKLRTIAVTSTSPEEGKTMVATNLAITMAQAGMRTLLIGSDLRKPVLDKAFGVERVPGLTDILLGSYPWRHTVKTITDLIMGKMVLEEVMLTPGLENLHFVTSGPIPPNPSDLVNSDRLVEFLAEAREAYDMIILDSCPILSAADAAILGTKVDGVLLVYRVGKVSRGLLKRSAAQLRQVKCNILGVILNGMKPDVSPDFYGYKYYSYYAYGHEIERSPGKGEKNGPSMKGGESPSAAAEEIVLKREDSWQWEDGHKKRAAWRMGLSMVATALLTAGILWQNGLIDPMKVPFLEKSAEKGKAWGPKGQHGVARNSGEGRGRALYVPAAIPRHAPQVSMTRGGAAVAVEEVPPEVGSVADVVQPKSQTGRDGSYAYSLYLAAFRTREVMEPVFALYREKGLSPYWAKVDLKRKGVWFRVFVGHFASIEEAQRFRKTHGLTHAIPKKTPYTTLIGTSPDKEVLEEVGVSVENLGYSPYVIEGDGGEYRLLVGAFITKEGAGEQQLALRASGVQSEVVKR